MHFSNWFQTDTFNYMLTYDSINAILNYWSGIDSNAYYYHYFQIDGVTLRLLRTLDTTSPFYT